MKKILFICICAMSIYSCTDTSIESEDFEFRIASFRGAFGYDNPQEAVEQLGKYLLFGVYTDFVARLDMTKISSGNTSGFVLLNYTDSPGTPSENAGEVNINSLNYSWSPDASGYGSGLGNNSQTLTTALQNTCFGQDVTFTIDRPTFQYSNEMYIPAEIDIHSISDEGIVTNSYTHKIKRNNVNLTWNSDPNNTNGVLAYVIWDGTLSNSPLGSKSFSKVEKAVVLPDTGSALLPSDIFDDIPADARLSFNLIRGNFDIVDGPDGKTYKNYGISTVKRKFLLMN